MIKIYNSLYAIKTFLIKKKDFFPFRRITYSVCNNFVTNFNILLAIRLGVYAKIYPVIFEGSFWMLENNRDKFSSLIEEIHIYSGSYKSFSKRRKLQRILKILFKAGKFTEELLIKLYKKAKECIKRIRNISGSDVKCKIKDVIEFIKAWIKGDSVYKKYAVTSVSIVAFALVFSMFFSFGYGVMADGEEIAVVKSRAQFDMAVENIDAKYGDFMTGSVLDTEPVLLLKILPKNKFSTDVQLENAVKSVSDNMMLGYSLKVDGEIIAGFDTEGEAERAVELFRSNFVTDEQINSGEYTYSYLNDVECARDYVPSGLLMDSYAASMLLDDMRVKYGVYAVKEGDSIESIVSAFDMTQREFKYLNPFVTNNLNGIKEVNIKETLPVLMVSTTQMMEYDEAIPFETEKIDDASSYKGTAKIVQEGQEGVTHIVEKVQRINGARKSYNIVSSEVVKNPVNQTVKVGTKKRPSNLGTGSFVRPYYGSISSRYGSRRSGFHTGVDFCGKTGDNIVAADNGTVTFAGWGGGYGYMIKIDHNNGYETYYAHCSRLLVKKGQTVAKGDVIARVGSTGNSTGPHLHFEVLKNGKSQNPMNYVN